MKTETHVVNIGGIGVGGSNPIVIQSMTDTDTSDIINTVSQIEELYHAGSPIARVTVNNTAAARAIEEIKTRLSDKDIYVPIVGDFHFIGHKILRDVPKCAELLDKYRINPGNLGKGNRKDENFKTFIDIAKDLDKPIRIGVNAGSLDQELLDIKMDEYSGNKTSQQIESDALVSSALISYDKALDYGLKEDKIIVSCKVSRLNQMVECYREISKSIQAPLHLGLTEAGLGIKSIVSTTAALSILLHEGIGDTIRSSLTPELNSKRSAEVELCKEILQSLSIRNFKAEVTACPGCGRTTSNYFRELTGEIKRYLDKKNKEWVKNYPGSENLKVAVMGCVVNGPGESKAANIGISLPGSGEHPVAPIYIDGEKVKLLSGSNIADDFIKLVEEYVLNKWGK